MSEPFVRSETFAAPGPIQATISSGRGDIVLRTAPGPIVQVTLQPKGPDERVRQVISESAVDFDGRELRIAVPERAGLASLIGLRGGVRIEVELPADSSAAIDCGGGDVTVEVPLRRSSLQTAYGDIRVAVAADTRLQTGAGDIDAESLLGDCEVTSSGGDLRVGAIDGRSQLTTTAGDLTIGRVAGDVRARTSAGDIHLTEIAGDLMATTSAGDIHVDCASHGSIRAETLMGDVVLGVAEGTAAWVDARSTVGELINELTPTHPAEDDRRLELRAATKFGDVQIRRARSRALT